MDIIRFVLLEGATTSSCQAVHTYVCNPYTLKSTTMGIALLVDLA